MTKLSPTMSAALDAARNLGEGRLYRWPGGYWLPRPWDPALDAPPANATWFPTGTIYALVARNRLRIVERLGRGDAKTVEVA